ncbi:unnamed protein product [Peniophora sp. CBMAI 1063]|nr:unnamed protein product [Peniophora sp. CBMAI 1063]
MFSLTHAAAQAIIRDSALAVTQGTEDFTSRTANGNNINALLRILGRFEGKNAFSRSAESWQLSKEVLASTVEQYRGKVLENPAISEAQRAYLQAAINAVDLFFDAALAAHRLLEVASIREQFIVYPTIRQDYRGGLPVVENYSVFHTMAEWEQLQDVSVGTGEPQHGIGADEHVDVAQGELEGAHEDLGSESDSAQSMMESSEDNDSASDGDVAMQAMAGSSFEVDEALDIDQEAIEDAIQHASPSLRVELASTRRTLHQARLLLQTAFDFKVTCENAINNNDRVLNFMDDINTEVRGQEESAILCADLANEIEVLGESDGQTASPLVGRLVQAAGDIAKKKNNISDAACRTEDYAFMANSFNEKALKKADDMVTFATRSVEQYKDYLEQLIEQCEAERLMLADE